ncbi:MAG: hypothetical protein D6714_12995 [Bacteroidetes bacterium]|nr:MAG: hypothetical protein D6714_12995 [Bacteroidota bacterium]
MKNFTQLPVLLAVLLGGIALGYFLRGNTQKTTTSKKEATTDTANTGKTTSKTTTDTAQIKPTPPPDSPRIATTTPKPLPKPTLPVVLPSGSACFHDDKELGLQLTLFAENMEKQQVMYDNKNPENLADCSGIFHRVVRFVADQCDQYDYPDPAVARDSRSLARWYNDHNNLIFITDAAAQRAVIKPGAVLFFGGSGKKYANPAQDQVLAPYPAGIIEHIGVVTEVKRDAAGKVTGYVMFHGRRPGVFAQRSHYHSLKPPRLGFPPLGNWNQQLVAVGYVMTPKPS